MITAPTSLGVSVSNGVMHSRNFIRIHCLPKSMGFKRQESDINIIGKIFELAAPRRLKKQNLTLGGVILTEGNISLKVSREEESVEKLCYITVKESLLSS